QACYSAFNDAPFSYVIAGAPLLALGVTRGMSTLLAILLPIALFVMLLLLVGTFRVRGRALPLLAAVAATVLTVGLTLLFGIAITPAVLAGIPVLLGLGVDYAVQLVARYHEQRTRGERDEDALRTVLQNTGGATLVAAVATLVGLLALLVVTGVDAGPLVAVPLVAEFALVLCIGVVLSWCGALLVALPVAVWSDHRRPIPAAPAEPASNIPEGGARTLAIADNLRGVLAVAVVAALAGWVLLGRVPVQTDVQQLLAPSLPELGNIETVQSETGYTNEVDVYVQGSVVTGALDTSTGNPLSVEWQCTAASVIRTEHSDHVVQATSIGDYVIGAAASTASSGAPQCVPQAAAPSPSPSPSPSASASPSVHRTGSNAAVEDAATTTPAPTTTPSPAHAGTPSASPSSSPSGHAAVAAQTPFLCDLRLFPLLSRTLVMPIGPDTQACPPVDEYQDSFLTTDASPINPDASRIVIGVHAASVADEARLVDGLKQDVSSPPSGITATPTGLAVLATTAYDNLVGRAYTLNIVPLVLVGVALLAVYREPRRALLPLLPTALAAGWAPLLLLLLGRLPGSFGSTLGSFTPLTVVLGSLVVALATEFGVVLLGRFYEERRRGLDPDAAAVAALGGVGRAIRVSALTLGAGFAVLALSGVLPNSLPLVADFGLVVVLDLALAVLAVFAVMLPAAVALERRRLPEAVAVGAFEAEPADTEPAESAQPEAEAPAAEPRRRGPGVSGRRRQPQQSPENDSPVEEVERSPRRPGVSGRRRGKR
ncbi:MAG: MMPL family transporter, partial [Candidatus Dormibacteraeota bacterium]|nr:MMPL family transporter [Candidatus Dormibacteraeota bacterium]